MALKETITINEKEIPDEVFKQFQLFYYKKTGSNIYHLINGDIHSDKVTFALDTYMSGYMVGYNLGYLAGYNLGVLK